jgi:hypothetical protein
MKKIALAGLLAVLGVAPAALAVPIYGVNTANQLVLFDSATPGTVQNIGTITQPGIVDIDFSPANGALFGFTSSGTGYFISPTSGLAVLAVTPLTTLTGVTDVDFNPVADRLRVFTGAADHNYRMVPPFGSQTGGTFAVPGTVIDDGTFTNTAVDLVASAYDNNFDVSTNTTQLFSIDTAANALVLHSVGPAFSTVTQVGSGLGVAVGSAVGFDVGQNGVAYVSDNNSLFTVNLTTGVATAAGTVGAAAGTLTTIAVQAVPEPTTAGILGLGVVGLIARRRRQTR